MTHPAHNAEARHFIIIIIIVVWLNTLCELNSIQKSGCLWLFLNKTCFQNDKLAKHLVITAHN
jgi:hypothetical protein